MREGSLVAQDLDLTRFELTGEVRSVVQQVAWAVAPWNLGAFSVSQTGTLTYRLGGGTHTQFTWFDRAGRALGTVGPPGDYLAPALSPDGSRIAFTRRDDDPAGDIWTIDVARQTLSRVTLGPGTDIYPVWAPDGSTLVFESTEEGLLARAASSTEAPRHLLASPSLLIPTQISSDGRSVIFFADTGGTTGFDIFELPMTGNAKPAPLVQSPVSDVEPQLSPDGRWLAYVTTETGGYETFVQPFRSGGAKWQVPVPGGRQPIWRRDSRELFLVTSDRRLYAIDVKAGAATLEFGEPRFLFDMQANTVSVRNSYAVTADGQRFLVNRLVDPADRMPTINVVVNWQAGTR
jgi:dipeptidyl aminopeptidase/acylaminoacyl peptidase